MAGTAPLPHCDLVMKGGVTSGVVYPLAVKRLSDAYRFRQIGGTSAGAIAAVFTAAAEYGRDRGGFDKIETLPKELSTSLLEKFQPVPALRPLFGLMLAALTRSSGKMLGAILTGYPRAALAGALPGGIVAILALVLPQAVAWGWLVLGLLIGLLGMFALPLIAAIRQAAGGLPQHDYGLCPGTTQPGYPTDSALCDWMARRIDEIAGLDPGQGPLTVEMLGAAGITVQTVTTDITTHRPYILPMRNNLHAFSAGEFRRIFPDRIVDHMIRSSNRVPADWADADKDLYYFQMEALPVVVLARMSLSFPGLISAVPLHRIDYTLRNAAPYQKRRRCLFSDGGVSSNFPVQLFDHVLPLSPTFGISLAELDPLRAPPDDPHGGRIDMPTAPGEGRLLRTRPFSGLGGLVMALFDSSKDWQDSLQAILTGYRERIVTVNLTSAEGGMNLEMEPPLIEALTQYGALAGEALVQEFDLRQHRLRRFLTELPALERLLVEFAAHWQAPELLPGAMTYPELVLDAGEKPYDLPPALRQKLHDRAGRIAALGAALRDDPLSRTEAGRLPVSQSRMRHIAEMG